MGPTYNGDGRVERGERKGGDRNSPAVKVSRIKIVSPCSVLFFSRP